MGYITAESLDLHTLHDRDKPQGPWADSRISPLITEVVLKELFCCTWERGDFP